jgi:hypothetical protein
LIDLALASVLLINVPRLSLTSVSNTDSALNELAAKPTAPVPAPSSSTDFPAKDWKDKNLIKEVAAGHTFTPLVISYEMVKFVSSIEMLPTNFF